MIVKPIINESIVKLFCVEVDEYATLYWAAKTPMHLDYDSTKPIWLTPNRIDAEHFGKYIVPVKPENKLVLLNMNSQLFRIHFQDQLNLKKKQPYDVVKTLKSIYGDVVNGYIHTNSEICLFQCKWNLVPASQKQRKYAWWDASGKVRSGRRYVQDARQDMTQADVDKYKNQLKEMGVDLDEHSRRIRGR
jgi:hypothetical protein